MTYIRPRKNILIIGFLIIFSCFNLAYAQIGAKENIVGCQYSYDQANKYLSHLTEMRNDVAPMSTSKYGYMSKLRQLTLSGSPEERKDASTKYYNDLDYEPFSLLLNLNFMINDLSNFLNNRKWSNDKVYLLGIVNNVEKYAFDIQNNPYEFMNKEVELAREFSVRTDEINGNLLTLQFTKNTDKLKNMNYYMSKTNEAHFVISNILSCQLSYVAMTLRDNRLANENSNPSSKSKALK